MVTLQSWLANTQALPVASATDGTEQFRIIQGGVSKTLTSALLATYLAGVGSQLTIGTTPISGGTSGNVLYNAAGFVGEYATTGSGNVVRATSPTLVTPALGTPSALVLTNATGLPVASLVGDTSTALGVGSINLGHASDTTLARVSAGVVSIEGVTILTTATGQPLDADLTSWAAITRASGFDTFVATPSSANFASLVTDETGSGALVFGTSPSIATPTLTGAVMLTGGTVNGTLLSMTQTWGSTGTYTGILYNVTDSGPANSASLLMDLQVGGTSKFYVRKTGYMLLGGTGANWEFNPASVSGVLTIGEASAPFIAFTTSQHVRINSSAAFGFSSGSATSTALDTILYRDAAATLALRNSTSAQTQRWYSSYTDSSNGSWAFINAAQTGGTEGGAANTLTIGSIGNGSNAAAMTKFKLLVDGTNRLDYGVTTASTWTFSGTGTFGSGVIASTGNLRVDTGGAGVQFLNRAFILTSAAGVINLYDQNANDFGRLTFGGTTSSFPALKRSTTSLEVRLADDSAYTNLTALSATLTGGTVTADAPLINGTQTWNNSGVTFTGWKLNVTNTASASASLLMDLQKDGTSQFKVDRNGLLTNIQAAGGIVTAGDAWRVLATTGHATMWNAGARAWSSTGVSSGTADVFLYRDAANTLALRNSTNAQTLRAYNTYTDSSNGEWLSVDWSTSSNVASILTLKNGTGTQRALNLGASGAANWQISTSGHFLAATDNTYDIGTSGDKRPRNIYAAGSVTIAGNISCGFDLIMTNSTRSIYWTGSTLLAAPSNGILRISNNAVTDFNRLQFGGTTSSFPALKRDGVGLRSRLADDSADTWHKVLRTVVGSLPSASTSGAGAFAIVTDATAPTIGSTVTGGGAVQCFVISDGSNWLAA